MSKGKRTYRFPACLLITGIVMMLLPAMAAFAEEAAEEAERFW